VRVLLVNDRSPGPGSGVEVHVARLAAALRAAGDDVEVFAGQHIHRGAGKVLDVWDPWARAALRRTAQQFRPDVVHHHNVLRELSVSVLGVPRGAATVLSVHDWRLVRAHEGPEADRRRSPMLLAKQAKGMLDRAVVRRAVDVLVAVAPSLERRLVDAGFRRVRTVQNFADADPGGPVPVGDDIVYAGRLSVEKGLDVLVEAFSRVADAHPGARLRLAGGGPEEPNLRRLAARVPAGRVVFEGVLSETGVRELIREARAVCAPSTRLTEGAPLVAIEAMLLGRPVVVTESPAFHDLLDGGELGVIVPVADVDALAKALDDLLSDRQAAQKLGERAFAVAASRHTAERAVETMHAVYREAIDAHR
jgi:glycosyltransferase involved in cell wall biosynthesis